MSATTRHRRNPTAYLKMEQAAAALHTNTRTLTRWIRQGKIPFVKSGRRYLFNPADLLNLPSGTQARRDSAHP